MPRPRHVLLLVALFALLLLAPAWAQDAAPVASASVPPTLTELKEGGKLESSLLWRFQSLLGLAAIVGGSYLCSKSRAHVDWKLVAWGCGLQLVLGFLIMTPLPGMSTPLLRPVFQGVNDAFNALMGCTTDGASFLFGNLSKANNVPVGAGGPHGPVSSTGQVAEVGAYFAFAVLPTIIFFSSFMAILYHVGVMQAVVKGIAVVMQRTMGTSGSETLCASGNIFVGQTEAPLLVRPFVPKMTESELMAVMVAGFATVAGGVMAAYVGFLRATFPDIAGHLLSASVMSAPAALVCAKLLVPEPDKTKSETYGSLKVDLEKVDANVIDAAARGAGDGLKLALNVGAMLLAFVAMIALMNKSLGYACYLVGAEAITLQQVLGWLCWPVAWLMGIPADDCGLVGRLVGVKTVANEFLAYLELSGMTGTAPTGTLQHGRSVVIATYALCGFANFSSIAIQIGGISGIAPERRSDLAKLGLKAMIAGNLACFMTACVAGLLI